MPVTRKLPPLPNANIPLTDPETGMVSEAWYRFFVALLAVLGEGIPLIP